MCGYIKEYNATTFYLPLCLHSQESFGWTTNNSLGSRYCDENVNYQKSERLHGSWKVFPNITPETSPIELISVLQPARRIKLCLNISYADSLSSQLTIHT